MVGLRDKVGALLLLLVVFATGAVCGAVRQEHQAEALIIAPYRPVPAHQFVAVLRSLEDEGLCDLGEYRDGNDCSDQAAKLLRRLQDREVAAQYIVLYDDEGEGHALVGAWVWVPSGQGDVLVLMALNPVTGKCLPYFRTPADGNFDWIAVLSARFPMEKR